MWPLLTILILSILDFLFFYTFSKFSVSISSIAFSMLLVKWEIKWERRRHCLLLGPSKRSLKESRCDAECTTQRNFLPYFHPESAMNGFNYKKALCYNENTGYHRFSWNSNFQQDGASPNWDVQGRHYLHIKVLQRWIGKLAL